MIPAEYTLAFYLKARVFLLDSAAVDDKTIHSEPLTRPNLLALKAAVNIKEDLV